MNEKSIKKNWKSLTSKRIIANVQLAKIKSDDKITALHEFGATRTVEQTPIATNLVMMDS